MPSHRLQLDVSSLVPLLRRMTKEEVDRRTSRRLLEATSGSIVQGSLSVGLGARCMVRLLRGSLWS